MQGPVRVDVNSAVVAYRPAAGEERILAARDVKPAALLSGHPWRTFRSYLGQRHYSGTYWTATLGRHVIYESRLELANLIGADFDSGVKKIAAQPFMLTAEVDGQLRRHTVDYVWGTDDNLVVVDVVRRERLTHCEVQLLCTWTRMVVEYMGWTYLVASEPARVWMSNVRFLAGYRREWLVNGEVLTDLRSRMDQIAGQSISGTESALARYPKPLVRPALMHLLWSQELICDLSEPLRRATVLEVST